jgi:hypothetical protein
LTRGNKGSISKILILSSSQIEWRSWLEDNKGSISKIIILPTFNIFCFFQKGNIEWIFTSRIVTHRNRNTILSNNLCSKKSKGLNESYTSFGHFYKQKITFRFIEKLFLWFIKILYTSWHETYFKKNTKNNTLNYYILLF